MSHFAVKLFHSCSTGLALSINLNVVLPGGLNTLHFLKCLLQTTVLFLTLNPSLSFCLFTSLHFDFSLTLTSLESSGNLKNLKSVSFSLWPLKILYDLELQPKAAHCFP